MANGFLVKIAEVHLNYCCEVSFIIENNKTVFFPL